MAQKKPLDYNYAKDKDYADEVGKNLLEIFRLVQGDRSEREERWMESYRTWSADSESGDGNYEGRSNLYIPQIRKEVETMTRRILKGIFPDDYLKADPNHFEEEELALVNTQVVRHYLDNVMEFKQSAEPWIKQGVVLGTSPLRSFWCKKQNRQFFKERKFKTDPQTGALIPYIQTVEKEITRYNAPVARAEDLFNVWVYPVSAREVKDIQIIFARSKVTRKYMEKKKKENTAHFGDDLPEKGKDTDLEFEEHRERMAQFGESGELQAISKDDGYYDLLEAWFDVELPDGTCVPGVVEIINEQLVTRIQCNPFWHQMPPFDFFRYIKGLPGEFYGRGLPEPIVPMQHQLNDVMNQGMDSATLALNNITIINPAFAPNSDSFEIEPGAKWFADPNGVKQFQFPDLSDTAIKNATVIRGMITEMSDNAPQLPDPIAGKARSTGQAQMAINEWQTDLFSFLESITAEGLNPFAKKIHMLLQQNLKDDDIIRVTGKYAGTWINRVVTPEMILGNFSFKWIGALQIENQSVKTQQMLNFVKVYQTLPPEARAGFRINWENFLIKLFRDGFLIKDTTNIIETARLNSSVDPVLEGRILDLGGHIKVQEMDDDEAHIAVHTQKIRSLDPKKDLYKLAVLNRHLRQHQAQLQQKRAAQQQAMMMQQMQMAQMMGGPQNQSQGEKQNTPGNLGQINESTDQADIMRGQRA